jgi:hypothetical protein
MSARTENEWRRGGGVGRVSRVNWGRNKTRDQDGQAFALEAGTTRREDRRV